MDFDLQFRTPPEHDLRILIVGMLYNETAFRKGNYGNSI
jgi:hypothetical protein